MFRKTIAAIGLAMMVFLSSGCCTLFKINCPEDEDVTKAELTIFKQKAQVETDVDVVKGMLYDKKGNLTKIGTEIQKAYNKARVEGQTFVNLVASKLTAGSANETDFVPQATAYVKAVDGLHDLVFPPLPVDKIVGGDDVIAGIIKGLTEAGIALYNNAQKGKADTIKRVTDDLRANGQLLFWDEYMKKIKVLK